MRKTLLRTVVAFLFVGSTARAADFTFLVPVTIQNMPEATDFRLTCYLSGGPLLQRSLSLATTTQAITGGAFSRSVTVEVNAMPPGSAGLVTGYSCGITVNGRSAASGRMWSVGPDSVDATFFARATRLTLREWRSRADGTIP